MKLRKNRWLTIDPGLSGTGYAVWESYGKLIDVGTFTSFQESDWVAKGRTLTVYVLKKAQQYRVKKVYIEFPQFMQSPGGMITARSGALLKLTWFVGMLHATLTGIEVEYIEVRDWKGQLPKNIVEKRVRQILGSQISEKVSSHVIDAIGIGLYKQGRF